MNIKVSFFLTLQLLNVFATPFNRLLAYNLKLQSSVLRFIYCTAKMNIIECSNCKIIMFSLINNKINKKNLSFQYLPLLYHGVELLLNFKVMDKLYVSNKQEIYGEHL